MNKISGLLLVATVASGAGVAERVVDPFDHYNHSFVLEEPQRNTELFYVSINWYDTSGNKHDDRVGDSLLVAGVLSAAGVTVIQLSQAERQLAKKPA